jgi:excisionase family DNA binding protein
MRTESKGKNMANKRYANIKDVSAYTSLPVKTLYEWASQRKIPSIKMGRRVLFDLYDIDKIMASMKRDNNQCNNIANKIVGGVHDKGI